MTKGAYRLRMDFYADSMENAMEIVAGWFRGKKYPPAEIQELTDIPCIQLDTASFPETGTASDDGADDAQ